MENLTPRSQRLTDLANLLKATAEQLLQVVAESHYSPSRTDTELIKDTVAGYYGINKADLSSKSRLRRHAHPRRIAMFMLRKETDMTLLDIGEEFERDHTTVIYGIRVIQDEIRRNPSTTSQLNEIKNRIDHVKQEQEDRQSPATRDAVAAPTPKAGLGG